MKTALTIAGSDSSGGAGIQADIKTMTANGVFAMSAITALTAQNTTGVTAIFDTTPQFLAQQLDAVFTDIYPDAVKIGMVSSAPLIDTIAERLHFYGAKHIALIVQQTRTSKAVYLGASPRASVAMMQASKAYALLQGRDFVTPEDIKFVAPYVLQHRLILTAEAEMEGYSPVKVTQRLIDKVEVPK